MKKLLFIINPKAGKRKNKDVVSKVKEVFEEAGYQVGIKLTKKRADGTEIAKRYGAEADLVVCMGGDGTLNEVMQGLADEKIETPLGYIPAGSTNDFASSLGLSSDPVEQAKFLMTHEAKALDLGVFNGRYFVYTASAGVFTRTSYATSQKLKNVFGHTAYVLAGAKEIFRLKKMQLRIETEDEVIEGKYVFVAINNATKVGGIMKLDKDLVRFNDGVFELLTVEFPTGPISLIKTSAKVLKQNYTGNVRLKQIKSARITDSSNIDWSLDGEEEKGKEIVEFNVVPNAIKFIY